MGHGWRSVSGPGFDLVVVSVWCRGVSGSEVVSGRLEAARVGAVCGRPAVSALAVR